MAIIIWNGDVTVLTDYIEPGARVAVTEADRATRKVILQAATENDALDYIANGSTLPTHANMFCVSGKVVRTYECGYLYGVEYKYVGVWDIVGGEYAGSGKRDIQPVPNLDGWDSGVETRIYPATSVDLARAACPIGTATPDYGAMMYTSVRAETIVPGHVYKVTAQLKGILDFDRPIKWIPRGYVEKQSQNQATYPGQTLPVPVESNQALVGVTAIWASTAVPDCSLTGSNATPDVTFGVPDNIWASIPNPINVYPYGWVLETREPDIIPGQTLCLVKDVYVYYQHLKPGNSGT